MTKVRNGIWYSFFHRNGYGGPEPSYFNGEHLNWVADLEKHFSEIKSEMLHLLASEGMQSYFNSSAVQKKNSWKTISFLWWGIEFKKNQLKCPKTISALKKIPGLVSASFSKLDAHGEILPHHGDTNAMYRCHLPMVVPDELPHCGFEVNGEQRSWKEGKLLLFCDAHLHRAWNHTDQERIIMILDVIREEHLSSSRIIAAKVMASLFLQKRLERMPFLMKTPRWFQNTVHFFAWINALWFIPFRNFLFRIFS